MAPKKSFKKAYADIVMDMALACNKISNRKVGLLLGVDETTIRRWRKENTDFDRAFSEAREVLKEKINKVAAKSLDVRKRKIVTSSPEGVKTVIEDVLPTHNDVGVFSKVLGLGHTVYSEDERRRDVLRDVMKQKVAGKYNALEAAQLLEAEGIKIPETLRLELEAPKIFESFTNTDDAETETANLTAQEAADAYKKLLG
ncbi:hypothetical protein [Cedecea neteri]|uniref:hypothetical protein n=1 Tax=Cedecea neteri TaxID=158822 RepID=UPI00289837C2|nr:hypothetical protein [Cedecea neteri]